jgi:hypothetical protein
VSRRILLFRGVEIFHFVQDDKKPVVRGVHMKPAGLGRVSAKNVVPAAWIILKSQFYYDQNDHVEMVI